ncbi:hypothetical protein AZI86_04320 [Bdellovibrio bacteriovorus]|uniref:Uncharacterized protein n=1 Tax=Bdellovibrio bacteriovorus TaxID=959 RepID=A0A150WPH1_BDEBC|nr:hypothetical protein [Bdellovibrio bacteriovorus]KYG66288.1 hypothetical protein AZI86_04320 [Bdellovibrio bacteriovorus]
MNKVDPKKVIAILFVPVIAIMVWRDWPITQAPGILVGEAPAQELIPAEARKPIKYNDSVVEPLATYRIRARVLSKQRYRFDHGAKVSPIDLALGWGPMSDTAILDQLSVSQDHRFYFLRWQEPPINEKDMMLNSANVHIIPANDYIKDQVLSLRIGQIVELRGSLVVVSGKDGGEWKSSLSREDSGAGACELMYVTQVMKF